MRFEITVESDGNGGYVATCADPQCSAHGLSPASALDALHEEIHYRLESCPATTVDDGFAELDVVEGM